MNDKLLERLCRCLAFHTVESEITASMMVPPSEEMAAKIDEAKQLIKESGFDIDALYPVEERPSVISPDFEKAVFTGSH